MSWTPRGLPGFLNLRLGLLGECPDAEWCSGSFPPVPSDDFPFTVNLCHPEPGRTDCNDVRHLSQSLQSPAEAAHTWLVEVSHTGPLESITFRWDHRKLRETSPALRVRIISDRRNCGVNPPTIISMTNPPQEIAEYMLCMGQEVTTSAFLICSWVGVRPRNAPEWRFSQISRKLTPNFRGFSPKGWYTIVDIINIYGMW